MSDATLFDPATKKPIRASSPEEAEALYRAGKGVFAKGSQVGVVNQAGEVGTLSEAELPGALAKGVRLASDAQMSEAREAAGHERDKARFGASSLMGQHGEHLLAQGAAIARGASLGLSDAAASDLGYLFGGEKGREEVSGRLRYAKEEHPIESGIGEVEGMLLPSLIPGGGVAGAAARAPGAAAHAVEGAAARLLTREGAGALERVAVKGLASGAGAATEGAIRGAGEVVSEHALGEDKDLTAEKLLAGATHGAVSWGLAGGLLGGVGAGVGEARDAAGRFLQRLRPADVDAIAEKQFGFVPKGLGDIWAKAQDASAALSGGDVNAIRKLSDLSAEGAEARRLAVFDAPVVRDQVSRDVRSQLDALLDSSSEITAEAKGRLKAEYVESAVKKGNEAEALAFAKDYASTLRGHVEEMLANPKEYGLVGSLKGMHEWLDGLDGAIARIEGAEGRAVANDVAELPANANAQLFVALDDTKRAFGRWTKAAQAVEKKSDPLALMRGRATRDRLQGIYEDMRKGLENADVWGKAAEDQAAINQAWSKQIDAQRVFDARLTTNVGRDPKNPWVDIRRVDPAKADAYVSGLTNPNNDLVHSAIRNYVDSTKQLSEAIGRSWELPPEKVAHIGRVGANAEAFGKSLSKAESALTLANQFQALRQAESGNAADMVTGALVGGGFGGPIGAAVGAIGGALAKPANTIGRLAALERLMQKVDLRIGSSIRGFFRSGKPSARAALPASLSVGREAGGGTDKAFMRAVAQTTELASNPSAASSRTGQSLAGLEQAAPQTSAALSAQTMRVTSFLASKVPVGMHDPWSLNPRTSPPMVSEAEKARFLRYVAAANDPTTVLDDMQHGRLTPEAVEALKACYPKLYDQVRAQLVDKLASAESPLPYAKRVQLGMLFDAPTDATLSPEFLAAISGQQSAASAEAEAQHNAMPGPPARPLQVANSFQTTFEAATSGRR